MPLIKSVVRSKGTRGPVATKRLRTKLTKRPILSVKIKIAQDRNHNRVRQPGRTKMATVTSALDRSKTNALKVSAESKSEIGNATTVASLVITKRLACQGSQRQTQQKQQQIRSQPVLIA